MRLPIMFLACALAAAGPGASSGAADSSPASWTAQALVPDGWRVETRAEGDLDGDGTADLAMVLIEERSPGSLAYEATRPDVPPPRILLVAFARREGGYGRTVESHGFLPPKRPPNGLSQGWMLFEDGSLEVSRGRLLIRFDYTRANTAFTFRWQDGALRLIGYDATEVSAGCFHQLSVNYLTARAKLVAGWIETDAERVRWRRLTRRPLLALDEIGEGEAFDALGLAGGFDLRCPARE